MTMQTFTAQAYAYGVRVDIRIEAADSATEQELTRALQIANATARAKHAEQFSQAAPEIRDAAQLQVQVLERLGRPVDERLRRLAEDE